MQGKVLRMGGFDQGFLIGCGIREALPGKVRFKLMRRNSTWGEATKGIVFQREEGQVQRSWGDNRHLLVYMEEEQFS